MRPLAELSQRERYLVLAALIRAGRIMLHQAKRILEMLPVLVVLLLVGCGASRCVEKDIRCEGRCFDVCTDGEWNRVACLPCGQSMVSQGADGCVISTHCTNEVRP